MAKEVIVPDGEFFNRMKLAFQISNPPACHYPPTVEDLERIALSREMAAKMAERGFEFRLFNTVEEVRIAAQAMLKQAVACGELKASACGKFVPCSVNSIIVAMTDMGRISSNVAETAIFRMAPCYSSDCSKSDAPMVVELAVHADSCDDTISFQRAR